MDTKRQVGAYLAVCERSLYEVIAVGEDGVVGRNYKTGYAMVLTDATIEASRLVRPEIPDDVLASLERAMATA